MLSASKHFNIIMGVDIHIVMIPPGIPTPMPHPFIGLVMDPMDYIPFIGATVKVNGVPLGNGSSIGSLGIVKHIPLGGPFVMPPLIGHEAQNFFGSATVKGDGSLFTGCPNSVMTCNDIGIPLGLSPELYAPTSVSIPIPTGPAVMVGGPMVPDLMSLAMSLAMGGLMKIGGKAMKKAGKSIKKKLTKFNHKVLKKNPNKFTSSLSSALCKMGFEPVNLVNGAVVYEGEDFSVPGQFPFEWKRIWYSDSEYDGPLGCGTHHNHDIAIREYPEQDVLEILLEDGRPILFPILWNEGDDYYDRSEKLTLVRKQGRYLLTLHNRREYIRFGEIEKGLHRPERLYNESGFGLDYTYRQKRLDLITDSAGRKIDFIYNSQNKIAEITVSHKGFSQSMVSYTYNEDGDLTAIADANNAKTLIEYDEHKMMKKTDRNGVSFYWRYDEEGRCVRTWGDGNVLSGSIEYQPKKGYNSVTNSLGNTSTYYYDSKHLVYKEVDALGHIRETVYTEWGDVFREIDEEGNSTGFVYDDRGNVTTVAYPDGTEFINLYDEEDRRLMSVDGEGNKRQWFYNEAGLLKGIIEADNGQVFLDYDENNRIAAVKDSSGAESTACYDEDHNLVKISRPDGSENTWFYDELGRPLESKAPGNMLETYRYDKLGRVVEVRKADSNVLQLKYNAYEEVVEARDQYHHIEFEYTAMGSMKKRSENGKEIRFAYDTEEQLCSIVNEKEEAYQFGRNTRGDIIRERAFDGITRSYRRDRAGKVDRVDRPNNRWTQYEYNQKGQISRAEHYDGTWENYRYNRNGLLIEAQNQDNKLVMERDVLGRISQELQAVHTVNSTYNKSGQRTHIGSSLGADINMDYNLSGQLTATQAKQGEQQWFSNLQYNMQGLEIERSLPGGVKSSWTYDSSGRPRRQEVKGAGGEMRRKKYYHWTPGDRLTQIVDELGGGTQEFTHDAFGNLASSRYSDGSYDYKLPDSTGNIYRDKDQKSRKYGAGGQLQQCENYSYHYDAEGNLVRKEGKGLDNTVYAWYGNGMLKHIRHQGQETRFEYDALGRRSAKIHCGKVTRWLWDGNVPLHEWQYAESERPQLVINEKDELIWSHEEACNKDELITWIFDEGTFRPSAKLVGEKRYSIITDYLGTPTQMFDEQGELTWEAEYDIYGKIRKLHIGSLGDCPFRYQGQYEDVETGLYYNRFRYYSPDTGTYVSQDPIGLAGGMPNVYAYVADSNQFVDTFGTDQITFRAAFNQAKRDLGIPKNVNTPKPVKVWDSQFENRTVWAFEGEHKGKFVVMHQEDKFGRKQHLHTATSMDGRVNPTEAGKYNQHKGHIPDDIDGFKGKIKGCH